MFCTSLRAWIRAIVHSSLFISFLPFFSLPLGSLSIISAYLGGGCLFLGTFFTFFFCLSKKKKEGKKKRKLLKSL